MQKRTLASDTLDTLEERFQWPLGAAVLALLVYLAVPPFARQAAANRPQAAKPAARAAERRSAA